MTTNRLIHEKSPYLLQHAHNPVDWYPWGEEAFGKAKSEDKPIFLSIGYSTCHWCHVMERESFENDDIAALLNRFFVPIKLDREERPDIDRIYMMFVQATTGSGGWPMSVFLTPDLKPIFGGTYFPPDNRYGRPGFRALLEYLANSWISDRQQIVESGDNVLAQMQQYSAVRPQGVLTPDVIDSCFFQYRRSFDSKLGGFGGAPKFPRPVSLHFLLRYYAAQKKNSALNKANDEALEMTVFTLEEMAKGGMYDQLGGGFHRYSVDDRWFVPHFEKMLYDQGQLAVSYLEAYQITNKPELASIARGIFDYVLRDMTHPDGGFYSAEDADSVIDPAHPHEKGEGAFYVFAYSELESLLGADAAAIVAYRYGAERNGNVTEDPHGEFTGKNILFEARSIEETARKFGKSADEITAMFDDAKAKLLAHRATRIRPHLDDKILTGWNALMISAFAKGEQVLGDKRYGDAAERAIQFILKNLYNANHGTLLRRYRDGEAAIAGFLDDYAFFANALLDWYETRFETYYLELAIQIADRMVELFEDTEHGAFFSSAEGDTSLVMRMKEDYDGAEPSGNSLAVQALQRLAAITDRADFAEPVDRALKAFASRLAQAGSGVPVMMANYQASLRHPRQIVLAGENIGPLTEVVRTHFLPETVILAIRNDEERHVVGTLQQALANMTPVDGKAAAYVCQNFACQLPVTEPAALEQLLH
jgi:uncharacterized protein YyaL (SSP411 family)